MTTQTEFSWQHIDNGGCLAIGIWCGEHILVEGYIVHAWFHHHYFWGYCLRPLEAPPEWKPLGCKAECHYEINDYGTPIVVQCKWFSVHYKTSVYYKIKVDLRPEVEDWIKKQKEEA